MKLKFDQSLEYQQEAIDAIVDTFKGQPIVQSEFEINSGDNSGLEFTDLGVRNHLTLSDEQLLINVRRVQEANDIRKTPELEGREFSIEMETGTGKTYVYLRSIFELSRNYGLRKFIIVVPNLAVREGVLKSIAIMKDHFCTLYDNIPFDYFVYDSKKLGLVHQFATSNQIQIMVINIQSFQKDVTDRDITQMSDVDIKKLNVINRENDKMLGRKPIDFIRDTNPIIIIDEPQSVDNTCKAKRAIANLNPAATLRYSATHHNPYNLLYKLDPVRAYDLRLVKRIEVASIRSDDNFNNTYVKLLEIDNRNGIKARVEIHREKGGSIKPTKLTVIQGDDLYVKSGNREAYRDGYIVQNIDCTPGSECIEFNNGKYLEIGSDIGGLNDDIMKAQVYETVEQHLKKERALRGKGIKVLTLFFIDKVGNYRIYNEGGSVSLGKIGRWFEESYQEISARPVYEEFVVNDIGKIHNGYFSRDKSGRARNTSGKTADDESAYNLIMSDKERLLDPEEPLRFIFSHSALREGWDNPNVFQICTLNETHSLEKKRQEIGRGLRLPVNRCGDRVHDENVNRLTIIANESYDDFAKSLQNELEEDFGIKFGRIEKITFANIIQVKDDGTEALIGQEESVKIWEELKTAGYLNDNGEILETFDPNDQNFELRIDDRFSDIKSAIIDEVKRFILKNRIVNARSRKTLRFNKEVQISPEFVALWDKIKYRTRYRVEFNTKQLIKQAAKRVKNLDRFRPMRITMTRVGVDISDDGVSAERKLEERYHQTESVRVLPNLLAYLQKETELTRHTLVKILKRSGRLSEFPTNPQQFMTSVSKAISEALHDLILEGIQYEKIAGHYWEMSRIESDVEDGIVRYLNSLYRVQNTEKCLFDHVEYDSEVEKQFARDLDNNEYVRLFVKLPKWFMIDTPIGPYNPDWAFMTQREEKLYFVRETKSTLKVDDLRPKEQKKIVCGKSHFKTIGVDFEVVTKLSEVSFKVR